MKPLPALGTLVAVRTSAGRLRGRLADWLRLADGATVYAVQTPAGALLAPESACEAVRG